MIITKITALVCKALRICIVFIEPEVSCLGQTLGWLGICLELTKAMRLLLTSRHVFGLVCLVGNTFDLIPHFLTMFAITHF